MNRNWIVVALLVTLAWAALAHEGPHQMMGKVVAIGENSITVETAGKEPKKVTILVTPQTKFQKSGASASLKDLQVGERVVVHMKEKEHKLEATLVVFGKPPKKK